MPEMRRSDPSFCKIICEEAVENTRETCVTRRKLYYEANSPGQRYCIQVLLNKRGIRRSGRPDFSQVLGRPNIPLYVIESAVTALSQEKSAIGLNGEKSQREVANEDTEETVITEDGSLVPQMLVKPSQT
ncbi:hypothetical protein DPMN_081984 [Dreissena polymorpha]|uniref:Uncharacterized protein n=1 Tax=Dreissena polymorpha TaxID=45954 RepID=A0A9D3Y9Y8_DREPO|nr:hypothetical protein DPMN_081984 [Dreissena polymorpha]